MHDARNRSLQKGNIVLIPAVITDLQAFDGFCNVTVEAVMPRRPDGYKEKMTLNTGTLILADEHADTASGASIYTEQAFGPFTVSVGTCG
jgi:hypothetical protein